MKKKTARWIDILPGTVVQLQMAWERRTTMCRMRNMGFTLEEIGRHWSVGMETARSEINYSYENDHDTLSPASRWMQFNVANFLMALEMLESHDVTTETDCHC